jgi:hypothetical protein
MKEKWKSLMINIKCKYNFPYFSNGKGKFISKFTGKFTGFKPVLI